MVKKTIYGLTIVNHLLYQHVNYYFMIICLQILFSCIMLNKLLNVQIFIY